MGGQTGTPSAGEAPRTADTDVQASAQDIPAVDAASATRPRSTLDANLQSAASSAVQQASQREQQQSQHLSVAAPQPSETLLSDSIEASAPSPGGQYASSQQGSDQRRSSMQQRAPETTRAQGETSAAASGVETPKPAGEKPAAAQSGQRPVDADSAVTQRRPSSALEIARRLRRAPAAGGRSGPAKSGAFENGTYAKSDSPDLSVNASSASAESGLVGGYGGERAGNDGLKQPRSVPKRDASVQQRELSSGRGGEESSSNSEAHISQVDAAAVATCSQEEQKEPAEGADSAGQQLRQPSQMEASSKFGGSNGTPSDETLQKGRAQTGAAARTPPVMSYLPLAGLHVPPALPCTLGNLPGLRVMSPRFSKLKHFSVHLQNLSRVHQ